MAVAACGAGEEESELQTTRWKATETARQFLSVESWELESVGNHGELFGVGDPATKLVYVHAQVRRDRDGGFALDFDLPKPWRMEYVPGRAPTFSGEIPTAVALALATNALDVPPSLTGTRTTSTGLGPASMGGTLSPKDALLGESTCLIEVNTKLLVTSANLVETQERAAQLLTAVKGCAKGSSIPDVNDAADKAWADQCIQNAAKKNCGPEARAALEQFAEMAKLKAAEEAKEEAAEEAPAPAGGTCSYELKTRCIGGSPLRVVRCTSKTECDTFPGSTFSAGACGAEPKSSGGCDK